LQLELTESGVVSVTAGLLGALTVAFFGMLIAATLIRSLVLRVNPWILSIPVFLLPIALNVGIGYFLMKGDGKTTGKVMIYGGSILSVVLPLFLATLA
jgi:hypothetical protein